MPNIRQVVLTNGVRLVEVVNGVLMQSQLEDRVTTVNRLQAVVVHAALAVNTSAPFVTTVFVELGICLVEIPRHLGYPDAEDTIATRTGIKCINILTLLGNSHATVVKRFAVTDLQVFVYHITLVDSQVQTINRVHAMHRLVALVVTTSMRIGVTITPLIGPLAFATNDIIYEKIGRIYINEQLIYRVATRY